MHTFPECPEMAPEDENDLIEAVVTCEGNLHDPDFSVRFQALLGNLKSILYQSKEDELLKVRKIEPWNSVRVTISIPKEAAQKLRLLAQQGSNVLRSLGILTVQVEGDQVISLTLAGQNNEPTEIVLRQSDGSSSSSSGGPSFPLQSSLPMAPSGTSVPLAILSASSSSSSAFRSPNVVAPAGESIPVLPPKSTSANPRPAALGGQFPFTSMIHAAQTMQRTDPALQHNNSSSNLLNSNVNENAVNSTNSSSVPASASPVTQIPQSSYSTPPVSSVVSNSNPSLLTQQQQGQVKSEQVSRFVLQQQHERGPSGALLQQQTSQATPQSQSLQLQIVNVNAPPPYPGVNSSSSNPSGNLLSSSNSFNHHHHQQLNSANTINNNMTVLSPSVNCVGAPHPSPSSNVTLVRSVSSPSMSSQPQILSDNLLLGVPHQQQQPMSSPLLVNLLQNNEALSPPQSSSGQSQQGPVQSTYMQNIMLPPSAAEQQKRFILHHQQQQQRKMKRGLSLDGASLGEAGTTGLKREVISPSGVGGSEPASPASSSAVGGGSMDSNLFAQFSLPSSSEPRITVPVNHHRPSELGTTATIIQGRTIIHQGNVRVFNPGQIRAIRLTQANTSSPSTIHFIQGKPVMTTSGESMDNCVVLNGPHPVMSSGQQQQFSGSNTILTSSAPITSGNQQQQAENQEPNVLATAIRSVDQSSRTSLNPPAKLAVSTSASNPLYSSSNSNSDMFIPPSQPLSSSSQTHQQQRLSNLPSSVTQQQRRHVVQSHEAKSTPSQHQQRGLSHKSSKEPKPPQSQLTSSGKPRQLLINPLTGHLEPMPSESSSDSDDEEDRRKPQQRRVGPKGFGSSRGAIQHRQILATTTTGVTVARVVKSGSLDSQRSSMEPEALKRQQQQRVMVVPVTVNAPGPIGNVSKKSRDEMMSTPKEKEIGSPQVTAVSLNSGPLGEKIKLRLKLEKSEPISPAYKVDVSFVKKSEKSSMSSPSSSSATMSANSPAPVGSPGEQPRVPPLHISLRGKNAAVVVSSPRREDPGGKVADEDSTAFPSFYDGKLNHTLVKVGKRTKSRVKSSGCESDPESVIRHLKNPGKVSRPRLSKDSTSLSGVGGFVINSAEGFHDTLKARLDGSIPISLSSQSQPLIITPVSVTGSNKDLISGSSSSTVVASSIPAPTVKLKKSRRKSESEMMGRLLPPPPLPSAPSSVPSEPSIVPIVRSLSKITEDTSDVSSLLFKHLSKKEESSGAPSVSVTVSQTITTTTTSLTPIPINLHADVKETLDQVLGTVTTTSVLTLTSTTTGASVTTLSQDVRVTPTGKPISSSLPLYGNPVDVSDDSNTLSITPAELTGQPNIPMLNRENIPKELDLASMRTSPVVIAIPEGKTTTPTSKSPKPLPDLLALPSKAFEEKLDPQNLANSISKENATISLPSNMTINKISIQAISHPPTPQSPANEAINRESESCIVPVNLQHPTVLVSKPPILSEEKGVVLGVKSSPAIIHKKLEKVPASLGGSGVVKIKGSTSTSLRPKVQTPRVSIGTSIDADLPTLIPSPSLRELLEKEKSLDVKKDLPAPAIESDNIKMSTEIQKVDLSERELNSKPAEDKDSGDIKKAPVIEENRDNRNESQSQVLTPEDPILPIISQADDLNPKTNSVSAPEMIELSEPLPSTVTPNAPLPFPLVLPKGEDQSGVPGEDSGIDSMDALSEKSPNQGESPARKEIEQFGESHPHIPHYDPTSVIHHHEQKLSTTCAEIKAEPPQPKVSESSSAKGNTTSEEAAIPLPDEKTDTSSMKVQDDKSMIPASLDQGVVAKLISEEQHKTIEAEIKDISMISKPKEHEEGLGRAQDEPVEPNPLPDPSVEEPPLKRIKTESENPPEISKETISERKPAPTVIERVGTPSAEQRIQSDVFKESIGGTAESCTTTWPVKENPNEELIISQGETKEGAEVESRVNAEVVEFPATRTELLETAVVVDLAVDELVPQKETSDLQETYAKPNIMEVISAVEGKAVSGENDETAVEILVATDTIKPSEPEPFRETLEPTLVEPTMPTVPAPNTVLETSLKPEVTNELVKKLDCSSLPSVANHVDAIQELNQHSKLQKHQVVMKKDNVKVRKLKLENIVAAIGTKNIERQQQAKSEPFELASRIDDECDQQISSEIKVAHGNPAGLSSSKTIETVMTTNAETISIFTENPVKPPLNVVNNTLAISPTHEIGLNVTTKDQTKDVTINKEEVQLLDLSTQLSKGPPEQKEAPNPLSTGSFPKLSKPEAIVQSSACFTTSILTSVSQKQDIINQQLENHKISPKELDLSIPQQKLEPIENTIPVNQPKQQNTDPTMDSVLYPVLQKVTIPKVDIGLKVKTESKLEVSKEIATATDNHSLEIQITQKLNDVQPIAAPANAPVPPPISIVLPARTGSPQKPVLEPQTLTPTPRYKPRAKLKAGPSSPGGRRILDGPPKLSKATETDPRPESANPPRLEMRRVEEPLKLDTKQGNISIPAMSISPNAPKIQIHTVSSSQHPGGHVSLASLATAHRSIPNIVQLTKATSATLAQATISRIPISTAGSTQGTTANLANAIPASITSIGLPLQASAISNTAGGTGQTVFAIHQNVSLPANLSHLQSHGPSSITVLPGGHKMVPIKLVTIPKQSSSQLQAISLAGCNTNRGSPNILEAVNLVTNAGSRSNSPKTLLGNSIQGSTALNLSSMSLAGGGNLHLVPISMASAVGGTSNPVKVIVSTPIKMQPSMHQSMMMKSVVMGQQGATIRVVRPMESLHNSVKPIPIQPSLIRPSNPPPSITTINAAPPPAAPIESTAAPIQADIVVPREPVKVAESIYKHVDGLEILDSALPLMSEDDLPFEADIIHDEKDLEDVLAGESFETVVRENGLHSPYDIENEIKNYSVKPTEMMLSRAGLSKPAIHITQESTESSKSNKINCHEHEKLVMAKVQLTDETMMPDSPIPAMRSSSPLFTYGNRSAKNSRPSTRSPSPSESDVHGEDQEIIDSFTRSPSQPKLSPQNRPPERTDEYGSPRKPDLSGDLEEGRERTLNQELSIEIPPVDLMVMSPSQPQQQTEERKSTRSTRSNTRLVSPDITAFRSDTPKPAKFSSKPDPVMFKNSPKPSPTGSLKMLSPNVSGLAITPSSSNRSSPILPNQIANAQNINSLASGAMEKIAANAMGYSNSTNSSRVNKSTSNKRKRQESDSSSASKDENAEEKVEIDLNSRPGKRRCSENAAELIKVCIGIEDTPKKNTMLIKKMEESKLKEAKMKKAMATLVEENEGDADSIESSLIRGRGGRSSRASSEDRSSSRGSSVQRNSGSSKASSKEDHLKEQKVTTKTNSRPVKQKKNTGRESPNPNATEVKKGTKVSGGAGRRSNRGALVRDTSPLTPAKTRTNVRKESGMSTIGSDKAIIGTPIPPTTSPPETENLRRKTRSCATVDAPDTDMASLKRRRISKDAKS